MKIQKNWHDVCFYFYVIVGVIFHGTNCLRPQIGC